MSGLINRRHVFALLLLAGCGRLGIVLLPGVDPAPDDPEDGETLPYDPDDAGPELAMDAETAATEDAQIEEALLPPPDAADDTGAAFDEAGTRVDAGTTLDAGTPLDSGALDAGTIDARSTLAQRSTQARSTQARSTQARSTQARSTQARSMRALRSTQARSTQARSTRALRRTRQRTAVPPKMPAWTLRPAMRAWTRGYPMRWHARAESVLVPDCSRHEL